MWKEHISSMSHVCGRDYQLKVSGVELEDPKADFKQDPDCIQTGFGLHSIYIT